MGGLKKLERKVRHEIKRHTSSNSSDERPAVPPPQPQPAPPVPPPQPQPAPPSAGPPASGPAASQGEPPAVNDSSTVSPQVLAEDEFTGEVDSLLTDILQDGSACVPWPHVRLMVRGSGAAGKTATINSMTGKPFESTTSTVGANMWDLELSAFDVGDGQGPLETHRGGGGICGPAVAAYAATFMTGARDVAVQPSMLDLMMEQEDTTSPPSMTSSNSSPPSKPSPEMVLKFHRGELQQNVVLRVQDTGGQPLFRQVLDLLSCPGGSVYLVVFSLTKLRDQFSHCMGEVVGQIEAIHAFAAGAPLVLAGTRRDDVSEEALRELSERVRKELQRRCGAAISDLVDNPSGDSCFFAVENTCGFQGDASIRHLVHAIGSSAKKLPSVKQRIPLLWLRVYEELLALGGSTRCVELQRVQQLALQCGMPHAGLTLDQELPAMLNFFHSLSAVLWWDTPSLRSLVVLDVQWLIDACSCFIRNFQLKDHTEGFTLMAAADQEAMREEPAAWEALTQGRATLQGSLLNIFWRIPEFAKHREPLLSLMVRFGLLVPVLVPSPHEQDTHEYQYLVPALMGEGPVLNVDDAQLRLYFTKKDQGQAAERRKDTILYLDEDLRDGFLPLGAFHGLCAGVVGCSSSRPGQHALHRNSARVFFDGEPVTLTFQPEYSRCCVMVRIGDACENGREAQVVDRLRVILAQDLSIYSNLQCQMLVRHPGSSATWVDIDALARATTGTQLECSGGEIPSVEMLQQKLVRWFTASCTFCFVLADKLRESSAENFPKLLPLQEMIREFPGWVVERRVSLDEACQGGYAQEFLAVSHRWEHPDDCDPTGVQLAALKKFLNAVRHIKYVFFDFMCMFQGVKTPLQKAAFGVQLPNINLLYLGASVLILWDYEYLGRFWTQFEAWLSMQKASAAGLVGASEAERRCSIECIHGAAETYKKALVEQWSSCDARKAHDMLSASSVKVTNMSDKRLQLPKIALLDQRVRQCVSSIDVASTDVAPAGSVSCPVEGLAELMKECHLEEKIDVATSWCERYGAQHVRDIAECELVEDFLETLQLKKIPERKVRKALSMA